jgi:18S rRNA (adenine1779-N6/adenine1780-N6)-dimethyltransferase
MEVDDGPVAADDEEWGGIMEVDCEADDTPAFFKEEAEQISKEAGNKTKSKKKKTRLAELVREKIMQVLEDVTEFGGEESWEVL